MKMFERRELKERGYNYLCVSRTRPKDCTLKADGRTVTVMDSRNRPITLAQVEHEEGSDYFLRVKSPSKAMTERSMHRQWRKRFEVELTKARNALTKKSGTKVYDKVAERVGRAQGRYPSVVKYDQTKRILSTQKAITTEADNALGERVKLRLCSNPTDSAAELYRALGYTPMPFRRYHIQSANPPPRKICSTHTKFFKMQLRLLFSKIHFYIFPLTPAWLS